MCVQIKLHLLYELIKEYIIMYKTQIYNYIYVNLFIFHSSA